MVKSDLGLIVPTRVYNDTFYSGNDHQSNAPKMIPIKIWCKQNNYTIRQARNLIRKKVIVARTFKNKLYILSCTTVVVHYKCNKR